MGTWERKTVAARVSHVPCLEVTGSDLTAKETEMAAQATRIWCVLPDLLSPFPDKGTKSEQHNQSLVYILSDTV